MKNHNKSKNTHKNNEEFSKQLLDVIENYQTEPVKYLLIIQKMIEELPTLVILHQLKAELKSGNNETLDEAIEEWTACIELNPKQHNYYYWRASCYEKQEALGLALKDIKIALELDEEGTGFSELLRLEIKAGHIENAMQVYEQNKVLSYQTAADELLDLAYVLLNRNELEQALEILEAIRYSDDASFGVEEVLDIIDDTKEQLHRKEIDAYRNIAFLDESLLRDVFSKSLSKSCGSHTREDIVNIAKAIFFKRILDVNLEMGEASPYRDSKLRQSLIAVSKSSVSLKNSYPDTLGNSIAGSDNTEVGSLSNILLQVTTLDEIQSAKIVSILERYIFSSSNISVYVFGMAFNSFIANADNNIDTDYDRGFYTSSVHISPIAISRIMRDILAISTGDSVFDPAAGLGRLLIADQTDKAFILGSVKTKAVGFEINKSISLLARMNLIMNGISEIDIQAIDAFSANTGDSDCDFAVCHPPFGGKNNLPQVGALWGGPQVGNKEFGFLQIMLSRLKWDGRFAIVIPLGLLSQSGKVEEFRKYLLVNDYIDQVIGLPERTLAETNMKTAIIFGTKRSNPRIRQTIKFSSGYNKDYTLWEGMKILPADDRELFREVSLDFGDLAKLGYILNPHAFNQEDLGRTIETYTSMSATKTRIKSVITKDIKGKVLNKKIKDQLASYPIIKIGNLKDDIFDNKLDKIDAKALPILGEIDPTLESMTIDEDCVLIALAGEKLKPTIFEFTGTPILTSPNVLALIPDKSKISCEYLVKELNTERAQGQIQLIRGGATISNIRVSDFLRVGLDVPTIPEQKARFEDYQDFLINQKLVSDASFRLALEKARKEFNDGLGIIRHQLGQIIGTASLNTESLHYFLKSKHPQILDDSIVPLEDGEAPNPARTVDGVLNQMKSSFNKMSNEMRMIQLITKGLKQGAKPEPVLIKDLFHEKLLEHQSATVNIQMGEVEIILVGKFSISPTIIVDKAMLGSALDQVILNAIKHGQREDTVLNIWLNFTRYLILEGEIYHEISIRNDGHPLPPQFSLELYSEIGGSTGVTGHSGIGGYVISKIVEMHDGILRAENLPTGQVEITILLPSGLTMDDIN